MSALVPGNAYGMQHLSESVKSAEISQSQENKILERSGGKLELIQEARQGSDQARAPEAFSNRVKLYIVGVPIDYKQEDPKRVREFENILIRAKRDLWSVYTSQPARAFMVSNKDGWETVKHVGISITVMRRNTLVRSEGNIYVANEVYALTQKSETPHILLRPGSPYLGDVPVEHLLLKFSHQMSDIEVLNAKSGPDLVGDLAQSALQRSDLSRQYLTGAGTLNISKTSQIKEGLLLILALDDFYKKGYIDDEKPLFEAVVQKLILLGFEDHPAYIKSAQSVGLSLTVNELAERADEFNSGHGYTLAILNENSKR